MHKMEIMAPAGGQEQLLAAVRAGADSVYLGAKGFNARRNAENFGDLQDAVSYCHGRGVRVYVTLNTLVWDDERTRLEETADEIAASGADAVIVQDLAVLHLLQNKYPSLERYASTQTAVHNVDGARMLEDLGFDSVVLARELELEEMARIASAVSIKCEAFVHGAHCMSLSGACYLSAMLGGRSGNRGLCAQPCRLDAQCNGRSFALSLKDMSLIDHMRDMSTAGVHSFKIEGRMKRPEYVACAVDCCRKAREGEPYDASALRAVFSRSGFTDGYLLGKRNRTMFGIRTREDAAGAEAVLGQLRSLYRGERQTIGASFHLEMYPNIPAKLTVRDDQRDVTSQGAVPAIPLTRPTTLQDAERTLRKTGGTPFYLQSLSLVNPANLTLPSGNLGDLRRQALDQLLLARSVTAPAKAQAYLPTAFQPHSVPNLPRLYGIFQTPDQITCPDLLDKLFLPADLITEALVQQWPGKLQATLPAVLFPKDEPALKPVLSQLVQWGVQYALVENLYGIRAAKDAGLIPIGGACLNITNSQALFEYEKMGLAESTVSFELSMAKAQQLQGTLPRGILVYGRLPLMQMRACPARGDRGCGNCSASPIVTDRKNVTFPLLCHKRRYSTLLNSIPLDLSGRALNGFDFLLFSFTLETQEEARQAFTRFRNGEKPLEPHTTGLYYREVL